LYKAAYSGWESKAGAPELCEAEHSNVQKRGRVGSRAKRELLTDSHLGY
jgi:hypothetical protein